jgi:deoxyinosine 3'endonuclease (endonuclease V)
MLCPNVEKMHHDIPTEAWIQEQYHIASQVIVLPDPKPLPLILLFPRIHNTDGHHPDDNDDDIVPTNPTTTNTPRFVDIAIADTNHDEMNQDHNDAIYYGGVDVSFPESTPEGNNSNDAVAVYVILEYPSFAIVYRQHTYFALTVPYIPSFLAFREIEPIQYLIQQQQITHPPYTPAALFVDGNGRFHPRRAGLACFVGIRTGLPTMGVGKTLYGDPDTTGRTKEYIHGRIQDAIRTCCGYDQSDTEPPPTDPTALVPNHPPSKCVVTFDCHIHPPPLPMNSNSYTLEDRTHCMKILSKKCIGLAIPIGDDSTTVQPQSQCILNDHLHPRNDEPHTNTLSILAYALVGHGGRTCPSTRSSTRRTNPTHPPPPACRKQRCGGTVDPIYISVGHNISLQEAVLITSQMSLSRIPEPIRQADLYGRALLRARSNEKRT